MTTRTDHNQTFDKSGAVLSAATVVVDVTADTNRAAILGQAAAAITNNLAYLAIGAPANPQVVAQVRALTTQVDKLIRLVISQLDDIT